MTIAQPLFPSLNNLSKFHFTRSKKTSCIIQGFFRLFFTEPRKYNTVLLLFPRTIRVSWPATKGCCMDVWYRVGEGWGRDERWTRDSFYCRLAPTVAIKINKINSAVAIIIPLSFSPRNERLFDFSYIPLSLSLFGLFIYNSSFVSLNFYWPNIKSGMSRFRSNGTSWFT